MTGPARDVADLVAALLRGLPAADLAALTEGRARLAVVPVHAAAADPPSDRVALRTGPTAAPAARATSPARQGTPQARRAAPPARRAAPGPDPARARADLAAMSRRDDGTAYLAGWAARDLRALAASLELRGVSGLRKADLVDRIVDRTIGFRLDSTAIRQL
ncbi:Rho termination factor N-terminal domain-containing protein [Micromonospora sp. NPDC048170]|uniref:Rho termination factor N-terminal domain-containing protein n=1 Tax=Micromonospora sp. NPDC048170 TaxID=3154819 RepID=UPI0033E6B713